MIGVFNPVIPEKANDILLGEGVVKANGNIIGATQGGSRLEIDRSILNTKYDGAMGPTKGMRKPERYVAKLIINFLKITYVNLAYGLNVTVSDGSDEDGTYKEIGFDLDFEAGDVLSVVSFEGFKHDGTACIIKVENVLNIDNLGFEFKEKSEVILPVTYTGFYTYAAPTTPGLKMWDYYPA